MADQTIQLTKATDYRMRTLSRGYEVISPILKDFVNDETAFRFIQGRIEARLPTLHDIRDESGKLLKNSQRLFEPTHGRYKGTLENNPRSLHHFINWARGIAKRRIARYIVIHRLIAKHQSKLNTALAMYSISAQCL